MAPPPPPSLLPGAAPADLRIEGPLVTGRPGGALLPAAAVAIAGGRVVALGSAQEVPHRPGERLLRAPEGGLVGPGLVDLLCYGGAGAQVADAEPEAIARIARTHAAAGTTALLLGLESALPELALPRLQAIARARRAGLCPTVVGVHLEGPFLAPARRGIHPREALRAPDRTLLAPLLEAAEGAVRLVTLAAELPGALELIGWLGEQGIAVSQGHSSASYEEGLAAARAGARLCTHLFNAMGPLGHREPGLAGLFLSPPPGETGLVASLIADGAHVAPAMVRLAAELLGPTRLALMTDAMAPAGLPAEAPAQVWPFGGRLARVEAGALRASDDGTLVGSVLTLDRALGNLARFTGWPLASCLPCASAVAARAAGLVDHGTLAVGAPANLVLFDAQGAVVEVILGGVPLELSAA